LNLRNIMYFLILNAATLGSWLFLYISLRYMEPALTAATLYGINPLATLIVSVFLLKQMRNLTSVKLLVSVFTIICMLLVGYTVSEGHSGLTNVENRKLIHGFIMAILTGFCMAIINVVSKKIYDNGFNLYQLMSMRFFLLLIVSFYLSKDLTADFNTHLTEFMIIAIFGNVIPLFMLQKGITLVPPVQVSYILLLTPLFVFVFQIFDSRLEFSIYSLIAIISVIIISFIGLKIEKNQEEKVKQQLQQEE
ncbi:DMT family transporter, partial [Photorhabdus sp. APURE]|uniref:DMT family transporter n=1 Tax=Photorhabdus aballayi TaxID=2991723 RepID=UPI00223E29C8